jgi:hypothetical protein
MMSYQYAGSAFTQKAVLNVAPNTREAGIWMSGGAPAVDSNNNLYVLTGNGTFDVTKSGYGDSLLKLNSSLQITQYFTPSDEAMDALKDKDFGSGGAAVLADFPAGSTVTHALICGGKDGTVYILNRDMLGGFGDTAAFQTITFGHAVFATAAFWNGSFYMGGVGGPLNAYSLAGGLNPQFSLGSASSHIYAFAGATPSVSSAALQNGVVWTLETGKYCTHGASSCGPVVLYAHDATNVATELWNSSLTPADAAGNAIKFTVPTVANGKVYVGTRGNNAGGAGSSTSTPGELDIYGLKP